MLLSVASNRPGRTGYQVIPFLDDVGIATMRSSVVDAFGLADDHDFFASPAHAHDGAARRFHLAALATVRRHLDALDPDLEPFMIAATTKGHTNGGPVRYHQDWTYTDERVVRPVFLWCPLVDVDDDNGALRVIPGSQTWTDHIRPSRSEIASEHIQDDLGPAGIVVPMRAGDALLFDPALLHGSGPNRSDQPRPAFTVAAAPRGAALLHFHEREDGALVGAEVDDAFFTEHEYGCEPEGYQPVAPWTRAVTTDDLLRGLRRVRAS